MHTAQRLVGTTITGLFDLRLMLQDHTTEEHADAIFKHTERAYDNYRKRSQTGPFTPRIRVVRDAGHDIRLEIVAPYQVRAVAKVRLHSELNGAESILTIAERTPVKKAKPTGPAKHINAGYCLNEVRRQLRSDPDISPQVKRLSSDAKAQLESFLDTCQMRAQGMGLYTLDLDVTDEGVSLVAYVDHKRMAAVSVFF